MLVLCQGCTGAAAAAAWGMLVLVLAGLVGAGYAIGTLRARLRHEAALRQARAALRRAEALVEGCAWATDAGHRLVAWHGPGQSGSQAALAEAGGLIGHPAVAHRLQAQQPFDDVTVVSADLVHGSRGWVLRGEPCHDELGRFAGFAGIACPTDDTLRRDADAAALGPLLASFPAPAVVLLDAGAGWVVQHANTAAQTLQPAMQAGAALDTATVPAALRSALEAGQPGEDGPWTCVPLPGLAGGRRAALLHQQPTAAAGAADAEVAREADNFSFTVSHDLRAPIRVVEGFTRIVKEDYGRLLDRVGNDHLDRVLGAAARMNLMIDALLTLAKLSSQPLARQPVNLSQLAGYVVDDLKRSAPEREAEIQIEPGLATRGDPTLLRLVLENLLGNAWKYSARNPRPQISLRRVPHDGPGGCAYVVRDNGAGFDMRSADRLFGLFQRLHSASEFPGHGVGLASVRRIVRRHGGEIWAEAEPGRGAAFYFTLG